MQSYSILHLIRSEDLNHHGTLFAGRSAEWFVESGFIAGTAFVRPENLVCVNIHGMHFKKPVHLGDVICYESKTVYAGRTSFIVYVKVTPCNKPTENLLQGFISFVYVDRHTKPIAHGVTIEPETPEEAELQQMAKSLRRLKYP